MSEEKRSVPRIATNLRSRIAVAAGWFKGSHVEMVEQVAASGFSAFESLDAKNWEDRVAVRARCEELGVSVGAVGAGGGTINGWGPVDPAYHAKFADDIRMSIHRAKELGSSVLVGLTGQFRQDVPKDAQLQAIADAGKLVAPMLEDAGITLAWEALNIKVNHQGYALVYSKDAAEVVRRTGSPNVKFLFDIYHQQISEGDVIRNIREHIGQIGHFHFGDNPGRHEPGTGELNFRNIFKAIHETGYRGLISAEFGKTCSTEEVLRILADCDAW